MVFVIPYITAVTIIAGKARHQSAVASIVYSNIVQLLIHTITDVGVCITNYTTDDTGCIGGETSIIEVFRLECSSNDCLSAGTPFNDEVASHNTEQVWEACSHSKYVSLIVLVDHVCYSYRRESGSLCSFQHDKDDYALSLSSGKLNT